MIPIQFVPWLRHAFLSIAGTGASTEVDHSAVPRGFFRLYYLVHQFTAADACHMTIQVVRAGFTNIIVASTHLQGAGLVQQVLYPARNLILFEGDVLRFQADIIPGVNTLEGRAVYVEMPVEYPIPALP